MYELSSYKTVAQTGLSPGRRAEWRYWAKKSDNEYKNYSKPQKRFRMLPAIDLGWRPKPLIGSMSAREPSGDDIQKSNRKSVAKVSSFDVYNNNYNVKKESRQFGHNLYSQNASSIVRSQFKGAEAKIGSLDNMNHVPRGGDLRVFNKFPRWNQQSKVGSLDNVKHVPRGGDLTVFNKFPEWKQQSRVGSLENVDHQPRGGDLVMPHQRLTWRAEPKVGSLENIHHRPKVAGHKIQDLRLSWESAAKVGSRDNIDHVPGGGEVVIPNRKLHWKARSKVDSWLPQEKLKEERGSMSVR